VPQSKSTSSPVTAPTLEWFGTSTFRLQASGLTLFFDAYLDRVPGLAPVGLSAADVGQADFIFVSHAHFDHLYGVDTVALRTGATIVCSPESARYLRASGVTDRQIIMVTAGETVDCGHGVKVRVAPGIHSCLYAASSSNDSGASCLGDLDISAQDQLAKGDALFGMFTQLPAPAGPAIADMMATTSPRDGGQLSFLLTNGSGSILVSGSAGYWRGLYRGLRPDVALLSIAGRPNVDGDAYQGSTAQFVAEQAGLLGAGKVAFCHHDPLIPAAEGVDIGPAAAAIKELTPSVDYFELRCANPVTLLS
jgi:L-ascorbate metabolism protein UlaG (beta-lactamase superfamily)